MAVSVALRVLSAPDAGVLCPIALILNAGITTKRGSVPLATPYSAAPGFVIAAWSMEPTTLLLPLRINACTLTAGDGWFVAEFVKLKVTTQSDPFMVPPEAAVNTSCPVSLFCLHAPVVPISPDVDVTGIKHVSNIRPDGDSTVK